MFASIQPGQTVRLHFSGSTQGLAMRARYEGEEGGVHRLAGLGVMSGTRLTACFNGGAWVLGNGRTLTKVEAV